MNNYFYLQAVDEASVVKLVNNDGNAPDIKYSRNGTNWTQWDYTNLTIEANTKMYFKGNNGTTFSKSTLQYSQFVMTGKIAAYGNIMSLLDDGACTITEVGNFCFANLFRDCKVLTTTPELPATTLANYCYSDMFEGCSGIISAPVLPATTLSDGCYFYMFYCCSSLANAPELPATILGESCYYAMFKDCINLTTAPVLPATELKAGCYYMMFDGCTSLTTAPELNADTLRYSCYVKMFNGCSKLNYIKAMFTTTPSSTYTDRWVSGVASTGTFVKNSEATWDVKGVSGIPVGWNVEDFGFTHNGLTFTAIENSTISLSNAGGNKPDIWYSMGSKEWTKWNYSTIELAKDSKIYFKGNNGTQFSKSTAQYSQFVMTGKISASGNIMSLLDNGACTSTEVGECCFANLFKDCTALTTPPELPATTLAVGCYRFLFSGCTSLTTAPSLPATTLKKECYLNLLAGCSSLTSAPSLPATKMAEHCYRNLFNGCSNLTSAPELPATSLAISCYANMFYGCSKLTTPPVLPATTLAEGCYQALFYNCTSLTTAPALPATTLAPTCYKHLFQGCTSLTTAPELNADTLVSNCYQNMFYGCNKLNYIKALFTTTPSASYTSNWVGGVASTGTFVKNKYATWNVTGDNGIPTGWSVETYPPTTTYTLTLQGDNCTLNGGGTYNEGTTVEISCVPNTGYYFVRWSDGNTNATRIITVNGDITLTAITAQESSEYLEIKARKSSGEYERTNIIWYLDYKVNSFIWDARVYTDFDNLTTNFEISDDRVTNISKGNSWIGDSRIYSFEMTVPRNNSDTNKEFTINITSNNGIMSDNITIRVIQKPKLPVLIEDIFVSSGDVENALVTIPDTMGEVLVVYEDETLARYTIDDCVSNYVLYYRNALGGIDLFPVTGKVIKSNDIEHLTINKKYDNRTLNFGKTNYENVLTERWQLYSGRLTDQQSKLMHHLINSTYVYLYDIQADKFTPVVITDTEMEYKTYKNNNNKMVYYTINVEASQTKYRR